MALSMLCPPQAAFSPSEPAGMCSPAAVLWKRAAPLGPMPNEDLDVGNLEALEKYRSFTRYFRQAERESRKPHWWNTYHKHTNPPAGTPVGSSSGQHGFVPKPTL